MNNLKKEKGNTTLTKTISTFFTNIADVPLFKITLFVFYFTCKIEFYFIFLRNHFQWNIVQRNAQFFIACFLDTSPINSPGFQAQSCARASAKKPEAPSSLPQNPRAFHSKYQMVLGTTKSRYLEIPVGIQEFFSCSAQTL